MAARRAVHDVEEEHENHERWLLTYADMITLLMVLFIVLFAISQLDLAKYQKLKSGLSEGFNSKTESTATTTPSDPAAAQALAEKQAREKAEAADHDALEAARQEITVRLRDAGLLHAVKLTIEHRGLVVSVITDQVLFDTGSDVLTPDGAQLVDAVSAAVTELPNPIIIEGHTDDQPIATSRFASNWELSTARATSVLRAIVANHGVDPARLSAAGYAETRPVADNQTADGRAANRRVEIVIRSLLDTG